MVVGRANYQIEGFFPLTFMPPVVQEQPYLLQISRLTVDKLGVKLYDRASAVVAELIANGYDADAEQVTVRLPLGIQLASKAGGTLHDLGFRIEVVDDGHGMKPSEARELYLFVGRDRRDGPDQGFSRGKRRPVMGRKGIGKLAPFGICKRIEVLSAGGEQTETGYLVSHFIMDYEKIVRHEAGAAELERGQSDGTYQANHGTTIRLSNFLPKRVPDLTTFHRQLAARFSLARPDFKITIEDTRNPGDNPPKVVDALHVPIREETRIDLSNRPVRTEENEILPVKGWIAMAQESYKNEEAAGVRIYARGKIAATTRDFEQPAGFTGEFTVRSYLVGEIEADWLDLDGGEDLIRSDRQAILWDSDYGRAFRAWGAEIIREIGAVTREPRRSNAKKAFIEKSNFEELVKERYPQKEIAQTALALAGQIGSFAAEDELEDQRYLEGLAEFILSIAPHKALIEAFQDFQKKVDQGKGSFDELLELFGKARVAETASFAQVAVQRVKSIRQLEDLVLRSRGLKERKYQELLENAPWLIEPTWSVITKNKSLALFKEAFARYWLGRTGEEVVFDIQHPTRQPDFTLICAGRMLHIVEIKKLDHQFDDADFTRLARYVEAFELFFENHKGLAAELGDGWRIELIADGLNIQEYRNLSLFKIWETEKKVQRQSWTDFLNHARTAHQVLLDISEQHGTTVFAALDNASPDNGLPSIPPVNAPPAPSAPDASSSEPGPLRQVVPDEEDQHGV